MKKRGFLSVSFLHPKDLRPSLKEKKTRGWNTKGRNKDKKNIPVWVLCDHHNHHEREFKEEGGVNVGFSRSWWCKNNDHAVGDDHHEEDTGWRWQMKRTEKNDDDDDEEDGITRRKEGKKRWLVMTPTEATDVICCSNDMKMMMTKLFPPANFYVHSRKEKKDRTVSVFRLLDPPLFLSFFSASSSYSYCISRHETVFDEKKERKLT